MSSNSKTKALPRRDTGKDIQKNPGNANQVHRRARKLSIHDSFGIELNHTVYALHDLCLSLPLKTKKGGNNTHTLGSNKGSRIEPMDFTRLHRIHRGASFVIRANHLYAQAIDKSTGNKCDQIMIPENFYTQKDYPSVLKSTWYFSLTTLRCPHEPLPIYTIESFFKWIKQHLRVKLSGFDDTS